MFKFKKIEKVYELNYLRDIKYIILYMSISHDDLADNYIKVNVVNYETVNIKPSTTGLELADTFGLNDIIVIKKNGIRYDIFLPLLEDCEVEFFNANTIEGKDVIWDSASHIMSWALETLYGFSTVNTEVLDLGGFYCEGDLPDGIVINLNDVKKMMYKICNKSLNFERYVVSKEEISDIFKNKPMIKYFYEKNVYYKCGDYICFSNNPKIINTRIIKAIKLLSVSSSYLNNDPTKRTLTRISGIAFPCKDDMVKYEEFQEEAKQRDHRKIGKEQKLFMFSKTSPGNCYFLPHGTIIFNKLKELLREEYYKRYYYEVMTPILAKNLLWENSGHWDNYKDDMFVLNDFSICPMNCPKHMVIYKNEPRHYYDLPLRYADFGTLHRNEASGALSGLTRVRSFHQDDAHIYCTYDQMESEIISCLEFLDDIYKKFNFTATFELSTRPNSYIGTEDVWEDAEKILISALNKTKKKWMINPGDGAFYGPKIDVHIKDAMGRSHQCGTIQLDFNLPKRFELDYLDKDNTFKQPVVIHRAIYGSFERFIAILTEHYKGVWPFWLSPRQVKILTISDKYIDYAKEVYSALRQHKIYVDLDRSTETIQKKVKMAMIQKYNYIIVIGKTECEHKTINVRDRSNHTAELTVKKFIRNISNN